MNLFCNYFWRASLLSLLLLSGIAVYAQNAPTPEAQGAQQAAAALPKIEKVTPATLYVEQGKMQETYALIEGTGLSEVRGAICYRSGAPYIPVLTRFVPTAASSQKLAFLVAPHSPLDDAYKVALITKSRQLIWVPIKLHVVAAGDARLGASASSSTSDSPAPVSSGKLETPTTIQPPATLRLLKEQIPRVTTITPSQWIPPTGQPQAYMIDGYHLDKITQLRLRAIEGGAKVEVPFQFTDRGLLFQLMTQPEVAMGTRYALDLIMDHYLAMTLDFTVGTMATQAPQNPPQASDSSLKPTDVASPSAPQQPVSAAAQAEANPEHSSPPQAQPDAASAGSSEAQDKRLKIRTPR